jgi:glycosyltransferase involved in cell wall biosynthesis
MGHRPLRVGIDSHSAERDGDGNATYTRRLVHALDAEPGDHALLLFAGNPAHRFYRGLPAASRARTIPVAQGAGLARIALTLGRAAARAGVDCLHVQYAAPLVFRRPLVVTVHDLGFLHLPESFPAGLRLALRVLVQRSVARAARVITCSEFCRRDIERRYGLGPGRVVSIPLAAGAAFGPRPREETAAVLARHGLAPGYVFALGRLNRRKNLERLLLAWHRLHAAGRSGVPLVIGGRPDYGVGEVLRRARLPADGGGVRFTGLIPDEDLPHFYAGAACFVYPSLFEGFGLPLIEAMACGTPVVTSDRTAMPELVDGAGLVVDPEDVGAIAEAMARVLGDRELARDLARRGLERSRAYSWAETARRTLAVYEAAAGHASR